MERRRYVLRYRGQGAKPPADVEHVRHLSGITVLDESSSKMLLVECDDESTTRLAEALPGWIVAPEQTFDVPDTRKRID
ncbi:MAG TPA: hypothetical protein VM386_04185 [Acidimicrobiales bacterium]|nr:hypothetical protein [Acidimicrobiales bacterium]